MIGVTIRKRKGDYAHCWRWKVVDDKTGRNMQGNELTRQKAKERAWSEAQMMRENPQIYPPF